jgi:CHAT domain-containing protein
VYADHLPQKASGRDRPRIFWCPSGELTLLPLHAAGIYRSDNSSEDCASDYVVSSYIPTLSSLRNACRNYQPLNRDHLTAVLVAAADAPGLPIINSVREEVQDVQSLLQAASIQILNDVDATVRPEDVLQHLEKTFLLHMATHGQQKPDPFRSRFALREGDLTIADLMRLELPNAVFAFLSACETARGRDVQPDQVVHLAASMLFCGFRSVIATFW